MDRLNSKSSIERLEELKKLVREEKKIESNGSVNNHIHTFYSFSPYSPAKAVWEAYKAGLTTAGIMDHDTVSGVKEFLEAGEIVGIATTNGVECRVNFNNTKIAGRRINNPDQDSIAYIALHAIPHKNIDSVTDFFKPYKAERNKRNREMTERINSMVKDFGIEIDFDKDIVPISKFNEGGTITERHLLYALALRIIDIYGKGNSVVELLKKFDVDISERNMSYLIDMENPYYDYDLLGVLKGNMVERFYINADKECPDVDDVIAFTKKIGAISAYAYLGDVGDCKTGDKKTQKFEDDYLELLFDELKRIGFDAVTYMPSRNTEIQLDRIRSMCEKYNFMQISGEDINSPRQSFICPQLKDPKFSNLVASTWELIRHERK